MVCIIQTARFILPSWYRPYYECSSEETFSEHTSTPCGCDIWWTRKGIYPKVNLHMVSKCYSIVIFTSHTLCQYLAFRASCVVTHKCGFSQHMLSYEIMPQIYTANKILKVLLGKIRNIFDMGQMSAMPTAFGFTISPILLLWLFHVMWQLQCRCCVLVKYVRVHYWAFTQTYSKSLQLWVQCVNNVF